MTRQVVLVTGPPAAGKSTLAGPLAAALGLPLLGKDTIKEQLYDSLWPGPGDAAAWSRRLSGAAIDLLVLLAQRLPAVVLDANLRPGSAELHSRLTALDDARLVEVYCRCPADEAARRFAERARCGDRHVAHVLTTVSATALAEFAGPVGVGTVIEVDVTAPVDVPPLADAVRAALHPRGGSTG